MTRMFHFKGGSVTEQDALDAYRELYWKKCEYQLTLADGDSRLIEKIIESIERQLACIVGLLGYTPEV